MCIRDRFIAASLTSPEILFLDEPTIGLDIQSKKDIRTFLKKMNEECHTTITVSYTHLRECLFNCIGCSD